MTAKVIGAKDRIGEPVTIAATIAAVSSWLSQHGGEVGQWFAENTGPLAQWATSIAQFLGIGPSYDASNGGEVRRQLEGLGDLNKPYANPYMDWLKNYAPAVWQSGDIWDAPAPAQRSHWKDVYEGYLAAGLPAGALLDANMVPVGLNAAAAAIVAAEQASGTSTFRPRSSPGGGTLTLTDGDSGTPPTPAPHPPQPPAGGTSTNTMLLVGGAAALFLLTSNRR